MHDHELARYPLQPTPNSNKFSDAGLLFVCCSRRRRLICRRCAALGLSLLLRALRRTLRREGRLRIVKTKAVT